MVPRLNRIALVVEKFYLPKNAPVKRACKACEFSGQKRNYDDYPCQRNAPITSHTGSHHDLRVWVPRFPIMHGDDWCGEFKKK